MKKVLLPVIILLQCSEIFAQHSIEKIWETDSVALRNPESVLYDPLSNLLYVSSMNAGAIVIYDTNGKLVKKDWVTGLTANKGSALFNGVIYTAEPTAVAVVNVATASVVKRIPVEGSVMLNDVAVDSKGIIYVSDTRGAKVYRIEGDIAKLYLDNMPGANGLLTVNTDLYVLTSTAVLKIAADKTITKMADGFESGLDGIVMIAANEFIISNYKGIIYYVTDSGTKEILSDTRASRIMANDISYNPATKTLFVPSYSCSCIIAYKVK